MNSFPKSLSYTYWTYTCRGLGKKEIAQNEVFFWTFQFSKKSQTNEIE